MRLQIHMKLEFPVSQKHRSVPAYLRRGSLAALISQWDSPAASKALWLKEWILRPSS